MKYYLLLFTLLTSCVMQPTERKVGRCYNKEHHKYFRQLEVRQSIENEMRGYVSKQTNWE